MLHSHFGAGRLGLGLVVPAFQSPTTESVILNRAVSGANATGNTALGAERRNALLRDNPERTYHLHILDGAEAPTQRVRYAGFHTYADKGLGRLTRQIVGASAAQHRGVVVTASVLKRENYGPVIEALCTLARLREAGEPIGPIFLVACENTVSAQEVLAELRPADGLTPAGAAVLRRQVTPVAALVDRMCVDLEEDASGAHPTVSVRTEP